jgi:hypothetical protein
LLFSGLKFYKNLGFSISEHCEWGFNVQCQNRYKKLNLEKCSSYVPGMRRDKFLCNSSGSIDETQKSQYYKSLHTAFVSKASLDKCDGEFA